MKRESTRRYSSQCFFTIKENTPRYVGIAFPRERRGKACLTDTRSINVDIVGSGGYPGRYGKKCPVKSWYKLV